MFKETLISAPAVAFCSVAEFGNVQSVANGSLRNSLDVGPEAPQGARPRPPVAAGSLPWPPPLWSRAPCVHRGAQHGPRPHTPSSRSWSQLVTPDGLVTEGALLNGSEPPFICWFCCPKPTAKTCRPHWMHPVCSTLPWPRRRHGQASIYCRLLGFFPYNVELQGSLGFNVTSSPPRSALREDLWLSESRLLEGWTESVRCLGAGSAASPGKAVFSSSS